MAGTRWKFEGASLPRIKWRFRDHGVDVQRPVEVRKRVPRVGPRKLVPDLGAHVRRIDPEENEVACAAVHRVSWKMEQFWRR